MAYTHAAMAGKLSRLTTQIGAVTVLAMIEIRRLTEATDTAVTDIAAILPQMTQNAWPLDRARLKAVLDSPARVMVAVDGERIVGVGMIAVVRQLKDTKVWLEDLVVDEAYRGQGIAKRLVAACIEEARQLGARSVNLTSRPTRTAHALYEAVGFQRRESLLYRLPLTDDQL